MLFLAAAENARRITTGGGFYFPAPRDTGQEEQKMEKSYILHRKGQAAELVTAEQVINNALEQERAGIVPRYSWRDTKTGENATPPGWLVWSTWADGCGVVYRRRDCKMILITGMQGDFCIV